MSPAQRVLPAQHPAAHISWNQVRAFRLRRHHLAERGSRNSLPTIVGDIGGAQAQVLSAAGISIWARVRDLRPEDLEAALWKDRSIAKAWCMRRTLYLLPSKDLAIFVRGSARRAEKEIRWMRNQGVSESELSSLLDAVLSSLEEPITRSELARRVSNSLGLLLRWERGGGWGSSRKIPCVRLERLTCPAYYLLHLLGARGVVCSGPNDANEATFVRADAWLPGWRDVPIKKAEDELLLRYLRAFGPATVADFVAWTRMTFADAREIWTRQEGDLAPVDIEGWPAWILRRDLSDLETASTQQWPVRLLPHFDSFLLGHMERWHLVDTSAHRKVYRNQGWVAPVVLVDGRVQGVWRHNRTGNRLNVQVESFDRMPRRTSVAIQEEVRDLGRYFDCKAVQANIG